MARRTLLLLAAFLVAAVGTGLVFVYASTANARALRGQHPVDVLVAKGEIATGTPVADAARKGLFEKKTIARDAATPDAMAPGDLQSIVGKVALGTIFPGEQILPAKFGSPSQATALGTPDGMIDVAVQLSDPARVAGFVQPGSSVAVFATLSPGGGATAGGTATFTRLLIAKAQVVAVGPTTAAPAAAPGAKAGAAAAATNPEQQLPRAILTLALSQRDAQKLVFASQQGQVYFALLTPKSTVTRDPGVNLQNLFK